VSAGTVRVFDDAEALARAAAEDLVACGREATARNGRFTVVLAGGSTPRRLYQLLAEAPHRGAVAWDHVDVFWGDERAVPPGHPDSNYAMATGALLDRVPVVKQRVHRIQAERADRGAAALDYQREIAAAVGADPDGRPPALDLILLGMGADGHTASLFPWSPALSERRRWVVAHFVPTLGVDRVTLTVPLINRAREIRMLVAGPDKAGALAAVLEGPPDPERLPAQLIRPEAGRLIWLVDRAAAAKLQGKP
jgi:6-phosphogluconolactonase